ncbi:hypothetical protein RhiJN_02523 [Ceratobasidium sp. AG-Ba]|nr:hypothetical protein RhiJN_02523 [Ceratobasidium sp. AG-Ba]
MPQFGNTKCTLSAPYGGGRSKDLMGTAYNDLEKYGDTIKFDHPITKIKIYHGALIDGLEITYNTSKGAVTVLHGAKATDVVPYTFELRRESRPMKALGVWGESTYNDQGNQVHRLAFKIYDNVNGCFRWTESQGNCSWLKTDTRKDVLVTGKLLGFAGQADNSAQHVGLNTVMMYSEIV